MTKRFLFLVPLNFSKHIKNELVSFLFICEMTLKLTSLPFTLICLCVIIVPLMPVFRVLGSLDKMHSIPLLIHLF